MKVYACPSEVSAPLFNPNDTTESYLAAIEAHKVALKNWLIEQGQRGRTGEILRVPVADGYAEYMLADGRRSFLVHLPYFDGYQSPDVAFLPKKEVLKRIDAEKAYERLFSRMARA